MIMIIQTLITRTRNWRVRTTIVLAICLAGLSTHAQGAGPQNFMGDAAIQRVSSDPTKPVPRGYIIPSVSPGTRPDTALLTVDIYQDRRNSPVTLELQAAIENGKGRYKVVKLKVLSDNVADNPKLYHSRREFEISYDEINRELEKRARHAPQLRVGPGTPLFVYAKFNGGHQWGGVSRGGIFFLPEAAGGTSAQGQQSGVASRRPDVLDIAFPITESFAQRFYEEPRKKNGLEIGGQIRSRVESEGKFQLRLDEADSAKKALFELAEDPSRAAQVLGPEWTVEPQLRYMKKNRAGNLLKDANGLPIPDPMVDTYYDNEKFEAAKNDMAIRYRWTEGNSTGSWNFKPGLTMASKDGIVDRVEYGVDTTDDKPETIRKFVNSDSPLNPFRMIRDVIPGSEPVDFLQPSVKVTDTRYKFLLKHQSGLIIEVSLDDVFTESLRKGHRARGRFVQLEMDIDHLATKSANTANSAYGLGGEPMSSVRSFLSRLGTEAFFEGRPVLHDLSDLSPESPVKKAHQAEFDVASQAIISLRNHVLGKHWLPGAQKYALAAKVLGLVSDQEAASSVKRMLKKEKKQNIAGSKLFTSTARKSRAGGVGSCGSAFN